MRRFALCTLAVGTALGACAQQVRPAASGKIYQEIQQLRHLASVLYVAAHPDDENTRLLAWLVNNKNIRTGYLSLTRGDGGQNILGTEQGEALGLIRTHELMEARKLDGAEQYFSRAIDFGFSKTHEETFRHWPQDILTGDAVWVMRRFRPDVVICRFPPDKRAGHGQHAASAIVAASAWAKAGDASQYASQLKYYPPWHPKRLLWNTYRFGDRNTTSEDQFKESVGQYIPALGMGAGELAGLSRSVHKSQGAGTPSVPGVQTEYFKLTEGDTLSKSLFDGIDITWGRVGRPDIGKDLEQAAADFDFMHPDASVPALLAIRKKIQTVKDDYWRGEKMAEIDKAILDCAGFMAEFYGKTPQAVAGASLPFTLHVIARCHTPITLSAIGWGSTDSSANIRVWKDSLMTFEHTVTIPGNTPLTQPYWLATPHAAPDLFAIPADTLIGLPETPNNLDITLALKIGDQDFSVKVPLSYKKTDPVKGDVVEQLRIVPGATVAFNSKLLIARPDGAVQADVRIHTYKNVDGATLHITCGNAPVVSVSGITISANTDTILPVTMPAASLKAAGKGDFVLAGYLASGGATYDQAQHLIQYSHLPTLQYFTPATVKVLHKEWKCTVKRIGYLEGAGDLVPTFLRLAGLEVDILKESDFTNAAKLQKYDAIVTGIRAVNVEKRMAYWLPVLFQYVNNGGTLVMQYNTTQDLATTKLGPYPFTIGSDLRVTEEDATIKFVDTKSRLLNYPNAITDSDFSGWVQERGLYFASKWDDHYKPVFEMNDAGEPPLKGGTLYAKYGKGNYVYTSLSFSRQVPNGNVGAIRLLMNMLSVGK